MSDNEKTEPLGSGPTAMGVEMAQKMMAQMGAGSPDPMVRVRKMMKRMSEEGLSPPPMMQMCVGVCAEMLTAIKRTGTRLRGRAGTGRRAGGLPHAASAIASSRSGSAIRTRFGVVSSMMPSRFSSLIFRLTVSMVRPR